MEVVGVSPYWPEQMVASGRRRSLRNRPVSAAATFFAFLSSTIFRQPSGMPSGCFVLCHRQAGRQISHAQRRNNSPPADQGAIVVRHGLIRTFRIIHPSCVTIRAIYLSAFTR
jgi:hypothetical protein